MSLLWYCVLIFALFPSKNNLPLPPLEISVFMPPCINILPPIPKVLSKVILPLFTGLNSKFPLGIILKSFVAINVKSLFAPLKVLFPVNVPSEL